MPRLASPAEQQIQEVADGGQHGGKEKMAHSCPPTHPVVFPSFFGPVMLLQRIPRLGQNPMKKELSTQPSLTRLPASLPHVGRHLILGGPSLLQTLWAIAIPVGICSQERNNQASSSPMAYLDAARTRRHIFPPHQLQMVLDASEVPHLPS